MNLRPLLRYTAYGWFGLAALSAIGAAVFLIGAAALAANGPPPSDVPTSGPLGMLGYALQAIVGAFLFWTLGLLGLDRAEAKG